MIEISDNGGVPGFYSKNQEMTTLTSCGFSDSINPEGSLKSKVDISSFSFLDNGIQNDVLTLAIHNSDRSITVYDFKTLERLFTMESNGEKPISVEDSLCCEYKNVHPSMREIKIVGSKLIQNYFGVDMPERTKN